MGIAGGPSRMEARLSATAGTPVRSRRTGILPPRGLLMRSLRSGRLESSPDSPCPVHPLALPAFRRATRLLGLALGSALSRLRESRMTVARLFARAEESALLLRMAREAAEILGARWDRVPERHRPHYHAEQHYRILRIRNLLGLSQRETAQMFRVSIETIARWEKNGTDTEGEVHRPLVVAIPPVRRFADVVRAMVKTMALAGFGGNDLIARTLARAGWKLSARTVERIRKERWPVPRVPVAAPTVPRAVRAPYPNHVWMVGLTDVPGLFGLKTFKIAVVFDVFSRMPLAARVFSKGPSAAEIARFVSRTARRRGRPVHFVSDRAHCRAEAPAPSDRRGSQTEGRARPDPLRTLPPASGPRRGHSSRDLLRPRSRAPLSLAAPSRTAWRRAIGAAFSRRLPRCRTSAARSSSQSRVDAPRARPQITYSRMKVYLGRTP